jgi:O-antigen ligase
MSAWPSPLGESRSRLRAAPGELALAARGFDVRAALLLVGLVCVLALQGVAVTQSYLWAAPLVGVLLIATAVYLPLVPLMGVILLVRIVTDASLFNPTVRSSGSLNFSGLIALLFIVVAAGLLLGRRQGTRTTALAVVWLCVFTAVSVSSHGASTVSVREGVREGSLLALAVIAYNSRGALNISVVTRLLQIGGLVSALVAIYQFGTHSGVLINGQLRSNGTFAHPNGASMFFAIATTASLWRYLDHGRRRLDAVFLGIYGVATITTFSLSGVGGLLGMLMAYGAARPGSVRFKFGAYALAALVVIGLVATPLGAERLASESNTQVTHDRGTAKTSLAWRLYKWETLLPEWERAPILGQGLGSTTTQEGTTSENITAGKVPHNEYLRYLVETGAVGLMLVLGGLVVLLRRLGARRGVPGAPEGGTLGVAVVIGCMVNALADNTFLYSTTGYAVALIVGAVLSMPPSERRAASIARVT